MTAIGPPLKAVRGEGQSDRLRVGVIEWVRDDELLSLIAAEVGRQGHVVSRFSHDAPLPEGLDVVLACGPFGSLMPVAAQLRSRPAARRPRLVLWMTEQLSNPALPGWLAHCAAELRAGLERQRLLSRRCPWVARRALRLRYYGDLLWLQRQNLLSVLAIPSAWLAQFLRDRGFAVTQAPLGSDPRWGADLGLTRDIPVLWIGSMGSRHRRRNLERVRADLGVRGIDVMTIDGRSAPGVFGDERVRLLNRTRIVLNLLRAPWDSNALRFLLAAPNRALVVSEPTLRHHPLRPGTHLVEAPVSRMADAVCRYLADDDARGRIVEAAHRLVTSELTLSHGVAKVMQAAAAAPRPLGRA